ncbi:MAG: CRISPR-associated DxTHG motif protein [Chloroflexi bacterium]|nr:MAG: CRISPR-associated DxTHG motif protein [Chloroflexota bacterium]
MTSALDVTHGFESFTRFSNSPEESM